MNKEFNGFDEMVEALEENEDMVECKECFDLFPKAECERSEVGYVCPVCKGLRTAPAQARFVDPYDCYTQEFPEVRDYNPDSVVEYEKEPGLGDALADLIKDEYEAIDGYEVADETIQHADIPEDEKDEILDTLDHIKEEEEEHIDELKELCPECDPEVESEEPKESEEPAKLEEAADDEVADEADSAVQEKLDIDLSNCIESSDMEIWGVEPIGEGTYKAVLLKRFENVSFRGYDEIEKVESEMFDLDGLFVFHFGKDGLPKLGRWDPELLRSLSNCEIIFDDERYDRACEETLNGSTSQTEELEEAANEEEVEEIPEEDIPEGETEEEAEDSEENENEEVSGLESAYEAALEIANETGVGQVFGYAKKDTEEFVAIDLVEVDDPEAIEQDLEAVYDDMGYAYVAFPEKTLEESLFESVQLTEANIFTGEDKNLNALFTNGYVVKVRGTTTQHTAPTYKEAEKIAIRASKAYPDKSIDLYGAAFSANDFANQPDVIKQLIAKDGKETVIAVYNNGKAKFVDNAAKLTKAMKNIKKYQKTVDKSSDSKAQAKAKAEAEAEAGASEYAEAEEPVEASSAPATTSTEKAPDETSSEVEDNAVEEPKDEPAMEETAPAPAVKPETFELLDKIFVKGYATSINGEAPRKFKPGTSSAALYEAVKKQSGKPTEEGKPVYLCANVITEADLAEAKNVKELMRLLNALIGKTYQKPIAQFKSSIILLAAFKDGEAVDLKKTKNLLSLIEAQSDSFEEYFAEESLYDEETPEEAAKEEPSAETSDAEAAKDETQVQVDPKLKAGLENITKAFKSAMGNVSNRIGRKQANTVIHKALQAAGINTTSNQQNLIRKALLGESLEEAVLDGSDIEDTVKILDTAAKGLENMKQSMHEEYHRYANPAELKAMEDIEELITKALTKVYADIAAWGYEAAEIDTQSFMCQEDETCLQYMLEFKDLDPDEVDDLASQLEMQLENEISGYKPVPEIRGISASVALPDYDLADEDEDAEGITKASFLFYVTFARNLF